MVHEFKPHAKLSETLIFSQQTNKTEKKNYQFKNIFLTQHPILFT